jgi:WD40 repeat protein
LKAIAKPRSLLVKSETRDRLDLEARSLFAASLAVPDLRVDAAKMPGNSGLEGLVWRVALHPDGTAMAIGTHKGPVLWERGKPLKLPDGLDPTKPRPRLAYSPDGKYLAFAPTTDGLELWDGALTRTMRDWKPRGVKAVLAVGFERDGKTLWACCADGRVQTLSLPELTEGLQRKTADTFGRLSEAAFAEGAARLAIGNEAGQVRLHDASGKSLRELPKATTAIEALAWSPDGRLVAVGTRDGTLQLWEANDGKPSHRLPVSTSGVSSVRFSPDGRWVMAGFRTLAPMKVWDVGTGEQVLSGGPTPWGFSRDGRHIAGGAWNGVAFIDLDMPQVLRLLTGHRSGVVKLAWSRDNQHLASLDSAFEVCVWDLAQGGATIDVFPGLRGDLFAHNAATALSDDAATVAYASGGGFAATALQRDVRNGKRLGEWPLPGGFEQLACVNGKFMLVREEDVLTIKDDKPGARRPTHAVAYDWEVGKAPARPRVVRPRKAGDVHRFFHHGLTPDGRYYWWAGPREPRRDARVEVREVATGRLAISVPTSLALSESEEPDAVLSGEGPYLWIGTKTTSRIYELASPNPPKDTSGWLVLFSPDARWIVRYYEADAHRATPALLALQPSGAERTWLEFRNDWNDFQSFSFSPDGRYLAWSDQGGTITVADLPALEKQVAAFEKTVLPK